MDPVFWGHFKHLHVCKNLVYAEEHVAFSIYPHTSVHCFLVALISFSIWHFSVLEAESRITLNKWRRLHSCRNTERMKCGWCFAVLAVASLHLELLSIIWSAYGCEPPDKRQWTERSSPASPPLTAKRLLEVSCPLDLQEGIQCLFVFLASSSPSSTSSSPFTIYFFAFIYQLLKGHLWFHWHI